MTPTSVGMRCPECARQRTKVKTVRSLQSSEPRVTYALIILNVVMYIASTAQGGGVVANTPVTSLIDRLGLNAVGIDVQHQYYRLITSGFMHFNLIHIGFNMYLLYLMGRMLEPEFGSMRFAALYFTALLAGSFGALILNPNATSAGASGAIFGLFGAAFVEQRRRGIDPMQTGLGGLIIINLIFSFAFSGISIGAHIGGLIGGVVAGGAIEIGNRRRSSVLTLAACLAVCVAVVAGALVAAHAAIPAAPV
ncbi:MAG: rhomboid family intramembrane serine protease [Solirubrobacteraceae bacterium]